MTIQLSLTIQIEIFKQPCRAVAAIDIDYYFPSNSPWCWDELYVHEF